MVPVTYLFVVLFGEGVSVNEFALAAWHRTRSARSTFELEWTAWASQYVLFCEWGRVLARLPWRWASKRLASEARLLLSQVVDRVGRIEAPPPLAAAFMYMYRLTGGQFRVFCESVPRQILFLGLLVFPGAARETRVLQFDKKSGAYHTSFNHQRSTKSPSQTQKCM